MASFQISTAVTLSMSIAEDYYPESNVRAPNAPMQSACIPLQSLQVIALRTKTHQQDTVGLLVPGSTATIFSLPIFLSSERAQCSTLFGVVICSDLQRCFQNYQHENTMRLDEKLGAK